MNTEISQKEIGFRINKLRKLKGLSQVELANNISISRPSLAQIELGNRSVSIIEFQKLSMILGFSLDGFISKDFDSNNLIKAESKEDSESKKRINVPNMNIAKFKNILLYILERCAGKPNVGETVLYKLLYFSDFNYYELYEEHLSGATYRKLPYGPVPNNLNSIISKMIEEESINRVKTKYHNYPQTRYLPLIKADLTQLKASETEVINKVIDQMSDWSASDISNYSHKDLPWIASKDGEIIDYELAFYRETPFSVRNYGTKN